jgi:hypothetical protein
MMQARKRGTEVEVLSRAVPAGRGRRTRVSATCAACRWSTDVSFGGAVPAPEHLDCHRCDRRIGSFGDGEILLVGGALLSLSIASDFDL